MRVSSVDDLKQTKKSDVAEVEVGWHVVGENMMWDTGSHINIRAKSSCGANCGSFLVVR